MSLRAGPGAQRDPIRIQKLNRDPDKQRNHESGTSSAPTTRRFVSAIVAHDETVIRIDLAMKLRDAGVTWAPAAGDHFAIPDRDLDHETFVLSDMIVGIHELPRGTVIGFNGTTEWALDDIEQDEAIWLPREDQLRGMLGEDFTRLEHDGDGYRVVVRGQADVLAATPEDAYGAAVLQQRKAT